jgi:hypothetical protein
MLLGGDAINFGAARATASAYSRRSVTDLFTTESAFR